MSMIMSQERYCIPNRYPKDSRLANAAGVEAAIRGDFDRAREFLQRAVELAPHSAEVRRNFSRIPMNVTGWVQDEPISPDPAAAP
jgi:Tfp pilus assembly protein PilF